MVERVGSFKKTSRSTDRNVFCSPGPIPFVQLICFNVHLLHTLGYRIFIIILDCFVRFFLEGRQDRAFWWTHMNIRRFNLHPCMLALPPGDWKGDPFLICLFPDSQYTPGSFNRLLLLSFGESQVSLTKEKWVSVWWI